jgi:hypothetical protein
MVRFTAWNAQKLPVSLVAAAVDTAISAATRDPSASVAEIALTFGSLCG